MTTISEAHKTDRVFEAVKDGFTTTGEICKELGLSNNEVSKCLYALSLRGRIEKIGTVAPSAPGHPAFVYRVKTNGNPEPLILTGQEQGTVWVKPEQKVIMTGPGGGGGSNATEHQAVGQANSRQAGGDHYTKLPVQPWDVMEADFPREQWIGFLRGCILKRILRFGAKDSDPAKEIEKIAHEAQKLVEVLRTESFSGRDPGRPEHLD